MLSYDGRESMAATAADLVGRERELAAIAEFLEADAAPRAVVIEGEPGIGKTAVWEAAVSAAAERGFRPFRARPGETESKLAFSGLSDLLGYALADAVEDLPPPQRRALEIALLLDDDGGTRIDRRAVAAGVLGALRALSTTTPLLVAIDDAQWLDRSSAAALDYAARRLGELPVALLIARRLGGESGFEPALAAERVLRLVVGPLEFVPLNALVHARLGRVLPRPQLHRIHELSGGNPFFALELARDPGRLDPARSLPPTLEVLVRDRISALPQDAQTGLLVAASTSHPTAELVDRIVGVRDALAVAEAAQVVVVEHGNVRFEHPLLASAAYGAADPARRRELHLRLAGAVRDPEERARHLAAAATGPDEKVARVLEEGAAAARDRGAPAAAAELSELAARLTPPDGVAAVRRRRADAGYFHFESGDSRQALRLLEEALAELPEGPERARTLIRLARVRSYSDDLEAATNLFLQAAAEAGDDRLTKARALEGAATQLFRRRTQLESAVEHAATAAKLASELGAEELVAEALSSQVLAEATLGMPEAAATLEAALAHEGAAADARILARPAWIAAIARMWWDEPAAVRKTFEDLVERRREAADEGSLAYVYVMLAQADTLLGELDRAEADAAAARDIAQQAGQATLVAYALAVKAMADAHRGRDPRAPAEEALELGRRTQGTPAVHLASAAIGLNELTSGRANEAAAVLGPLVDYARREGIREPSLTRFAVDHIEALVELRRLDEATAVLDWYEEGAERLGRRSAIATAWRCRGLLAGASGLIDDALAAFERALAEHEAAPLPFDRARTRLALGAALRRSKRKADARRALDEAVAAFDTLGAEAFAARGRSELERIGGRKPSKGVLTATERQIAELVAEGRSNKEVAATLFVSVKTVEANLSRAYAKLGIRSRTGLARHLGDGESPEET
jgi:DNA-binding CsgD family transcriptional regulator